LREDEQLTTREIGGMTLADYSRAFWKRKWLVLLVFSLVVFFAAVFSIHQPKIYEAVASVEIDLQAERIFSNMSDVYELGDLSYWDSKSYFETQYKILQSRMVAEMVVERLHLDRDLVFLGLSDIEDETELAERLAKADAIELLRSSLLIDPVQDSRLVRIRYQGTDPKLITTIVNTVAEAYIEQNLNRKLSSTKKAISWLTEQMQDLKTKLEDSERALYAFKKENDILSTSFDQQINFTGTRLEELSRELSRAESEALRLNSDYESIKRVVPENDGEHVASSAVLKNPLIKELKVLYASQQDKYEELLARYKEKHPEVLLAKTQLERTRASLEREIAAIVQAAKSELEAAESTVQALRGQLEAVKNQARGLTVKEVEYNRLRREKESNQAVFEQVLLRLKEIDLSGMLKANNIRMLDDAKAPTIPIRPRVRLNILMGVVLGVLLAFGTALILEVSDKTLKSADDIQRYVKLPLLGIVPQVKVEPGSPEASIPNAAEMFAFLKPTSSMAECCRTVRTNINFMMPGKTLSRLLITSASPKEGKTTIVSNLAIAIASAGHRVIVLDTDMRRPRIHKAFNMTNEYGLSNLIMGTMKDEEAIRHTPIENLDVLTCGPIPPNPSELVGSEKFVEIVNRLSKTYDRIIFDSPPVIAVTDAMVLSNIVDGVILVVKCGKTLRDEAAHSKKLLLDVNANLLGVVINHLDLDNREYGHYYYYYYRRYGYYYGDRDAAAKTAT